MVPESQLFDFMQTSSNPASVKTPKSGKYTFSNVSNAAIMGFKAPDAVVGLTVDDLNFSKSQRGSAWAEKIKKMDSLAEEKKCVVEDTHEYLNENGILVYKTTTKLPLIGVRGNVFGIVTFSRELTQRLSRRLLYLLYKKMYGKKIAVERTLRHLEIETWFFTLPTEMELLVLIERTAGKVDKEIAKAYDVSARTIETHFINLRAKLKGDALPSIISRLRNPGNTIDAI